MRSEPFINYLASVKRYSPRTCQIYREAVDGFIEYTGGELNVRTIRNYEQYLLGEKKLGVRTVNQQLSALSSWCRFLVRQGELQSNPVRLVRKPKTEKRLPEFYRQSSIEEYFAATEHNTDAEALELYQSLGPDDKVAAKMYSGRLSRLIISLLYETGIRRAELISLTRESVDLKRRKLRVTGKGNKTREIPLTDRLCDEISLYLKAVDLITGPERRSPESPLLITGTGSSLYPVFVDRTVKRELGSVRGITGRKSAHVLRHTIASELLTEGADLNAIKEFLGHSSLAATQVYTHNTAERLKAVYDKAHPRAQKTKNHGD